MNLLDRWIVLLKPFGFSERFVKWSFVASISALLENRCFMFDNGGGICYPTLYVLLVGAPATFKTTTCDRSYYDLLDPIANDTDGPFFGPTICTPQQMVHIFRRTNAANQANDYLSSPMFVYAPEFTTFYRDIGGGEVTVDLLNFYDPKPLGKSWVKETVKDGRLEVFSPALTILGCTTPRSVIDSKMLTASGTGIVSRFIFVYEPNRPPGCSDRPDIRGTQELKTLQAACQVIRSMRGEFKLSASAEATLQSLTAKERAWHQAHPADTLFSHYMARRGTQLRKLSMIFSAISRRSLIIESIDLINADNMLKEIEPDMPQAFGAQIKHNDSGLISSLINKIPVEGISERELFELFLADGQALPKGPEFFNAINGILALGWIIMHTDKKTGITTYKKTR